MAKENQTHVHLIISNSMLLDVRLWGNMMGVDGVNEAVRQLIDIGLRSKEVPARPSGFKAMGSGSISTPQSRRARKQKVTVGNE